MNYLGRLRKHRGRGHLLRGGRPADRIYTNRPKPWCHITIIGLRFRVRLHKSSFRSILNVLGTFSSSVSETVFRDGAKELFFSKKFSDRYQRVLLEIKYIQSSQILFLKIIKYRGATALIFVPTEPRGTSGI